MDTADELRLLRERLAVATAAVRREDSASGPTAFVGVTFAESGYPTTAGVYYAIRPATLSGAEVEGQPAGVSASATGVIHALNLGAKIPPAGTIVLVIQCGDRYAFRFDG